MQEREKSARLMICILAFLLGCAAGCLTGYFCSSSAAVELNTYFTEWYLENGALRCLTSEVIFSLLFLLCSESVIGYLLIPILNSLYGYCFSVLLFVVLLSGTGLQIKIAVVIPAMISILPLLRISKLCSCVSLCIARMWNSNGIRGFDMHSFTIPIWSALLILVLLLPLRLCLLSSIE